MTALAYLFPPVSGLVAYLKGSTARTRRHGLQAIALGAVWPASLYVGSWLSPGVTQAAFALGALVWLFLLIATAAGRDPRLPGVAALVGRDALDAATNPPEG